MEESDYTKYRGKCKEMSEAIVVENPTFRLVRGHYWCPMWGNQQHWWVENDKGEIIDPTKDQFPSKGNGDYTEFDGNCECAECGKKFKEEDMYMGGGNYALCSSQCYGRMVGVC